MKDAHDPRDFRRFAQCDAAGVIVAMIEVATTAPDPVDTADARHVDISTLGAVDLASESVATLVRPALHVIRLKPPPVLAVNG